MPAIVRKIQRWSPATCDCVIEQFVDYDDTLVPGMNIAEPQFLMMNDVCGKHAHLKTRTFRPNHAEMSASVLKLIEEAKTRNLKQIDDRLATPDMRRKTRKELQKCRELVIQHNNELDEEWQELVEPAHAFDSHIHDRIREEQPKPNG